MWRQLSGRAWLLAWVALFALWLALVGTLDRLDVVAGSVAAAVAATAAVLVRAQGLPRASAGAHVLRYAGHALARVPGDTARVLGPLARGRTPNGAFRVVALPPGDWRTRGPRGVAALIGSLAPNTIVVDVDGERRQALVHDLVRPPDPEAGL